MSKTVSWDIAVALAQNSPLELRLESNCNIKNIPVLGNNFRTFLQLIVRL